MKSVLISIQPKWCELIASGKKTVEVRKSRPKLETPFKVYIYCTNNGGSLHTGYGGLYYYKSNMGKNDSSCINGKVIGEFVCDDIYTINKDSCGWFYGNCNEVMGIMYAEEVEELYHCISDDELKNYLGHYIGYGWHISNLVIYDKPRELEEFLVSGNQTYDCPPLVKLKRPPQSWCYVESEREG